jgi:hypothetical protein
MASTPDKDEVRRMLTPHHPVITQSLLGAWNSVKAMKGGPMPLYRRVRAGLVHNFAMNEVIPVLEGQGVHVIEKHETAFFLVGDRLLFRIKKGDERGLSSNAASQASLAFVDLEQPLSLFTDLPDVWRVDITYILNPLDTLIKEIAVVARDGDKIIWSDTFYPTAAEGDGPIPLPVTPPTPQPPDSGMRLPSSEVQKKEKKKGE